MIKNIKGFTLFEMLATISIAGIVLTLMTSILFTTLFTKNQVEYINRLDDEIFDITSFLSGRFQNKGYGSILLYEEENLNEYQTALIITREFNPVSGEETIMMTRSVFESYILLIDSDPNPQRNGVYFHRLFHVLSEDNPENPENLTYEAQIENYIESLPAYVTAYLSNVSQGRPEGIISSDNLVVHSASVRPINIEEGTCVKQYNIEYISQRFPNIDRLVSNCSNAFVELNLIVSYRLRSGEALDPKDYKSTLFF